MNSTNKDVNTIESNENIENIATPNALENESVKLIESTEEMMREGIKSLYNTYQSSLQILKSISSNKQLVESIESTTNHTQSIVNLLDKASAEPSNSVDPAFTITIDVKPEVVIDSKIESPINVTTKPSSAITSPTNKSILKKTSSKKIDTSTPVSYSINKSDGKPVDTQITPLSDSKIATQSSTLTDSKSVTQSTTVTDSKTFAQNTTPFTSEISTNSTLLSDSKISSPIKPVELVDNTIHMTSSLESIPSSEVNNAGSNLVTSRPSEEFWSVEDVCEWLGSMRLSYYEDIFRVAQIDGNILKDITDTDLTALGVLNPTHRSLIIQTVANIRRIEAYELPKANSKVRFSRPQSSKYSESDEFWSVDDVCDWLASMRLSIYEDIFRVARIDGNILYGLTEVDLLALGVLDKAHRDLILNAIHHFKLTDVVLPIVSTNSNTQSIKDDRIEYKPAKIEMTIIGSPSPNSYTNSDALSPLGSPSGTSYYTYTDNTSIRSESSSDLSEASSKSSSKDNLTAVIDIMKESTEPLVKPTTELHISTETYPSSKIDSLSPTSSTTFSMKFQNGQMPKTPMPLTFLYEFVWTYSDLKSYIINNEIQELNEALDSIFPDFGHFDKIYIKASYSFNKGTVYTDIYSRQEFHINKTDKEGNSLLIIAAQAGNILAGKLLYAKGANIDHQNLSGSTALHFARANKHYEFATWLIDVGANDNIRNEYGLSTYEGVLPSTA